MSEICPICGLPKDLCVCETIAKETQKIVVRVIKKKFGKVYTSIEGIDTKEIDIKEVTKKLKSKFACGGTSKNGVIELQGNHRQNMREYLIQLGFPTETIDIM
jgi:translation initiation factor 1